MTPELSEARHSPEAVKIVLYGLHMNILSQADFLSFNRNVFSGQTPGSSLSATLVNAEFTANVGRRIQPPNPINSRSPASSISKNSVNLNLSSEPRKSSWGMRDPK